jgi:polar amino acid transport system substrate-binding protein
VGGPRRPQQALKQQGFRNLVGTPDPRDSVRRLMSGEVQLAVFTDITVADIAREAGYSLADLEPVLAVGRTHFYVALSRDTPADGVAKWQATLDQLKQDGTFERIYRRSLPDAEIGGLVRPY